MIPGKIKTSSKSNSTNNTAKKKKGALSVNLGFNDSNPASKDALPSFSLFLFSDKRNWAKENIKTKTKGKNNKIITTWT